MNAKEISKQIEGKIKKFAYKDHNGLIKYEETPVVIKGDNFYYQINNPNHAEEIIKRMSKINEDKKPTEFNILDRSRSKNMQKFYAYCLLLSDFSKGAEAEVIKDFNKYNNLYERDCERIFSEVKQLKTKVMKKETVKEEKAEVTQIVIESYSEKAVVVWGQTKPIRELLKEQGGRFNPYLKKDGENCPGWIFSKKREAQLREVLKVS